MRSFVLSMLIAGSSLFFTEITQAGGGGYRSQNSYGYHTKSPFSFSLSPHVQDSSGRNRGTASATRSRTIVVNRCTRRQAYYDGRGRLYHNTETVITYKKIYRDGSYKIYKRTYQGY